MRTGRLRFCYLDKFIFSLFFLKKLTQDNVLHLFLCNNQYCYKTSVLLTRKKTHIQGYGLAIMRILIIEDEKKLADYLFSSDYIQFEALSSIK